MTSTFKTYVITNPAQTSVSFSLNQNDLAGYEGFLYLLMGSGGQGGSRGPISYGGSSGFINSGYIDLSYPYNIGFINVSLNSNSVTSLQIGYTGPNYDPTGGNHDFILTADQGQAFEVATSASDAYIVTGIYAPSNGFSSGGNPYLINQKGINSSGGPTGPLDGQGGLTDDFCKYQPPPTQILGGGGFYGGTVGASGPTGPYGFSSGSWFISAPGSSGTLGYAILTLIPSSAVQNTFFFTGSTGTIGNTGIYLYSLLGGGGGGGNASGSGGGGSGDISFGFINSTTSLQYDIGQGGTASVGGGDTSITNDNYISTISAIGGAAGVSTTAAGGDGFFAGGLWISSAYGKSYINIPNNIATDVHGTGFVSNSYGQGSYAIGGGGGGPYGGNYNTDAQGYGCGGGAGNNGSGGYAILKQMIPNCFTYKYITSTTSITRAELFGYSGMWGFLESPATISQLEISRNYFNIFHFLIREDNVQDVNIIKDVNGYFNVSISFSKLNNKTQQFNMKATHPSSYMYLILYV